jgi:hypothetical protein
VKGKPTGCAMLHISFRCTKILNIASEIIWPSLQHNIAHTHTQINYKSPPLCTIKSQIHFLCYYIFEKPDWPHICRIGELNWRVMDPIQTCMYKRHFFKYLYRQTDTNSCEYTHTAHSCCAKELVRRRSGRKHLTAIGSCLFLYSSARPCIAAACWAESYVRVIRLYFVSLLAILYLLYVFILLLVFFCVAYTKSAQGVGVAEHV